MRTRVDEAAGYLALTLGLYVAAAGLSFAQVSGMWGGWSGGGWWGWLPPVGERGAWAAGLGYLFCVGVGVYLLDRVKLSDLRLDPADAVAHPERAAFIARHSGAVRGLMMVMFAAGAACGAWIGSVDGWLLVAMEGAACAGVVVYAGKPRVVRARPKDVLVVKNACIGGAITGFAAVTMWVVGVGEPRCGGGLIAAGWRELWAGVPVWGVVIGAGQLFVRVMADSIICDLEDEEADRAFGTATLATRFGRRVAWNVASGMRVAVGAGLIAAGVGGGMGEWSWKWGVVTVVSTVVMRVAQPRRVRDWTDMRFPLEVVAVMVWVG